MKGKKREMESEGEREGDRLHESELVREGEREREREFLVVSFAVTCMPSSLHVRI